MKGRTLEMLQEQWGRAMLDGDWAAVERIDAARQKVESLPARKSEARPTQKVEASPVRSCVWAGSEVCRHCEVPLCSVADGAA